MIREVTGAEARIVWGYRLAASLRDWTITKAEDGTLALSASVTFQHAVWISQRPLVFEASHAKGVWTWPIDSLQIVGGTLTATLNPQEEASHVQPHASA